VPDLSEEIAAFMDAVGLESAVIVGSSSGGYIAQWFAGDHPDRTRGLVLVGSPGRFRDKPAFVDLRDTILALSDPIDPEFARQFGGDPTFPHLRPGYIDEMVEESCRIPAEIWKATYLGLWDSPPPSTTFRISIPSLLLWGDRDHFLPRQEQEALCDAIPGSKLVVYEGVGHIVLWEEPERVARDIVSFVAALPVGARLADC
jgi:pimeloyl-ACP methyl ester carboxylesterase